MAKFTPGPWRMTDRLRIIINACTVTKTAHDNEPNCVRVHVPSLITALRAALDAEQEPFLVRGEGVRDGEGGWTVERLPPEPSPTNEERAVVLINEVVCYGRSMQPGDSICDSVPELVASVQEKLAAAEARGLERAAKWHDAEEEKCKQRMKEMAENPLRLARCKGLAAEHREYAAAIRALKEE